MSLKTGNGHYVAVDPAGARDVHARSSGVDRWEVFERVDLGGGKVALKAFDGPYVTAIDGGFAAPRADANQVTASQTFTEVDLGGGNVALRAASGTYLSAENNGGARVYTVDHPAPAAWETFVKAPATPPGLVVQDLAPKWPPFALPSPCANAGEVLGPVLSNDAAVVVGGPRAIHLLDISRQGARLLFTIKATTRIFGYTYADGYLFVQDGAVLSSWDLKDAGEEGKGICTAAINLGTGARQANEAGLGAEALAALHAGSATYSSTATTTAAAASDVFSAPAVREHQKDAVRGTGVFVLRSDGMIYSLDRGLEDFDSHNHDVTTGVVPQVAMQEVAPRDGSVYSCWLYYVCDPAGKGTIRPLDASAPEKAIQPWSFGPRLPTTLPLSFEDGLLWGGGVSGHGFFGVQTDHPDVPIVTADRTDGAWSGYEVDPATKLCAVYGGSRLRLLGYRAGTNQVDRAGTMAVRPGWPVFVDQPSSDARVMLYVEQAAGEAPNVSFSLSAANTVDVADHAHARNYPPSPRTLGTGQLKGGARGVFARLLATPTVDRSDLYVVADAGPGTGNGYLAAYATTALYRAVGPAAALEARRLAALAQGGFRIKVVVRYVHNVHHSMFTPQQWIEWDTKDEHGPAPMPGRTFRFQVAGGSVDLTTDVDSVVWLDAAYLDQTVQVDTGALPDLTSLTGASDYTSRSTASVKLDSTDVRTLEVAVERWEKEDS